MVSPDMCVQLLFDAPNSSLDLPREVTLLSSRFPSLSPRLPNWRWPPARHRRPSPSPVVRPPVGGAGLRPSFTIGLNPSMMAPILDMPLPVVRPSLPFWPHADSPTGGLVGGVSGAGHDGRGVAGHCNLAFRSEGNFTAAAAANLKSTASSTPLVARCPVSCHRPPSPPSLLSSKSKSR
jgi:hypothetical protein